MFFSPTHGRVINRGGGGRHSRLAELDQVLVRGPRMEAANVQVGFAQLFPSPAAAAVATAVGVGTGGRHLVAGGHIGLLQRETKTKQTARLKARAWGGGETYGKESTGRAFSGRGGQTERF